MRKIMSLAAILIIAAACVLYVIQHGRSATKAELDEFEQRVNARLTEIEAKQDTTIAKLILIEADTDSLKAGQIKIFNGQKVIYEQVKKQETHFWDEWFN